MTIEPRLHLAILLLCVAVTPALAEDDTAAEDHRNWLQKQVERRVSHHDRELPWLVGDFNLWSGVASAAVLGVTLERAARDDPFKGLGGVFGEKGPVVNLGDELYKLTPGAAYVTSLAAKDYRGFVYMGLHNVFSSGAMKLLKDEVGQRRPGDQSNTSFPSGHTNTAFLGAAFLQQRYGSMWGIPSYISAALVAWSRVYGNKHYVNDVVSGASIGMMSAWAIVPPYDAQRRAHWEDPDRERPFSYEWEMTLNDIDRNVVQAPDGSGDLFTSPFDRQTNEPWANSHVAFEYRPNARQAWAGRFTPWESRSFGQFAQPTQFAGELFPAGEQLRIAHLLWNWGAQYRHAVVDGDALRVRFGAGISGQRAEQEIFVVDDTQPERRGQSAVASASVYYAVGHVDADVRIFSKLWLSGEADYGTAGDSEFLDWSARLKLRVDARWDIAVGWRSYRSDLRDASLRNDFERSGAALNVVYSF